MYSVGINALRRAYSIERRVQAIPQFEHIELHNPTTGDIEDCVSYTDLVDRVNDIKQSAWTHLVSRISTAFVSGYALYSLINSRGRSGSGYAFLAIGTSNIVADSENNSYLEEGLASLERLVTHAEQTTNPKVTTLEPSIEDFEE